MIGPFVGGANRSGLRRSVDAARPSIVVLGVLICASLCLFSSSSAQVSGKTRLYTEQELK